MARKLTNDMAARVFRETVAGYQNFGFDLSYMRYVLDERPHYRDGRIVRGKPKGWAAGSAADGGIVYINPDLGSVFQYYGMPPGTDPEQFCRQIMGHELAHEIWREHASPEFRRKIIKEARQKGFQTPYLKTVPGKQYDEELFCEYLSHLNSSNRRLNMNIRKNFSRVVVYNGQYNFDRTKRYSPEEGDPNQLLAGMSDQDKRLHMQNRANLDKKIVRFATDPNERLDTMLVAQIGIDSDPTGELPAAQKLDESLKALRKKGREKGREWEREGMGLPKVVRRALFGKLFKDAEVAQAVYNSKLARGVAKRISHTG